MVAINATIPGIARKPAVTARNKILPLGSAVVCLTLQAPSGASVNTQEWANTSASVVASVDKDGNSTFVNGTYGGTLGVTGNFAVNTNKFSVAASNGNTLVAGTLGVTGAVTGLTFNGLTLTALSTGFTVAGGTTSKTLTVPLDATVSGTNTGDQTITLTSDVTGSGTGSFATTIAAGVVTLAKMANIATATVIGRMTAGTGVPEALPTTGTGNAMFSASPTTTGTMTAAAANFSGNVTVTGSNISLGDAGVTTTATIFSVNGNSSTNVFSMGAETNTLTTLKIRRNSATLGGWTTANTIFSLYGGSSAANHLNFFTNGNIGVGSITDGGELFQVTGTARITGATTFTTTVTTTGVHTFTAQPIFSSATISTAAAFDASKGIISVTITGSGNAVYSASPTLTGTIGAAALTLSSTIVVTGTSRFSDLVGIGVAPSAGIGLLVQNDALTGTSQYGMVAQSTFTNAATTQGNAGDFQLRTAAASFIMTTGRGIRVESAVIGSGSTVTTLIGIDIDSVTGGGTNNLALRTNAGQVSFRDTTDATTTATGGLITGGGVGIAKALWVGGLANIAGVLTAAADLKIGTVGKGLYVKEGTNATMGVATLVLGVATVSTNKVTANSRIFLTPEALGTIASPVALAVTARSAGTSFTITSANLTDTSTVAWIIVEPA